MTIVESIRDIYRRLRSTRFVSNDNVKWFQRSDSEWEAVVDVPPILGVSESVSGMFPCKIVSKDGVFYNVEMYEDGIDSPTTGTAKVYILQLNLADTLGAGTWIMAGPTSMGVTGGGNVP